MIHTPWILFPVTGHLGPLALFLVLWYTNFPPIHVHRVPNELATETTYKIQPNVYTYTYSVPQNATSEPEKQTVKCIRIYIPGVLTILCWLDLVA